MKQYTPLERGQIAELYIKNNYSIVKTQRKFRATFKSRSAPAKNTIKKIYEKFTSTAYLGNSKKPNKPKPKRSSDNIERVKRSIEENPTTSSRRRAAQLNIAHTTLRRIIHQDLAKPLTQKSQSTRPAQKNESSSEEEISDEEKETNIKTKAALPKTNPTQKKETSSDDDSSD